MNFDIRVLNMIIAYDYSLLNYSNLSYIYMYVQCRKLIIECPVKNTPLKPM